MCAEFRGFSEGVQRDPRGPGTIRMAERLEELAQRANPVNNIFLNVERAKLLQVELEKATTPSQRESVGFSLAGELLDSDQNLEALQQYEAVEQALKASNPESY